MLTRPNLTLKSSRCCTARQATQRVMLVRASPESSSGQKDADKKQAPSSSQVGRYCGRKIQAACRVYLFLIDCIFHTCGERDGPCAMCRGRIGRCFRALASSPSQPSDTAAGAAIRCLGVDAERFSQATSRDRVTPTTRTEQLRQLPFYMTSRACTNLAPAIGIWLDSPTFNGDPVPLPDAEQPEPRRQQEDGQPQGHLEPAL